MLKLIGLHGNKTGEHGLIYSMLLRKVGHYLRKGSVTVNYMCQLG